MIALTLHGAGNTGLLLPGPNDVAAFAAPPVGGLLDPSLHNTGNLILQSPSDYAGATTVNGGTLTLAVTSAIPDGTALTVGDGATLVFDSTTVAYPLGMTRLSAAGLVADRLRRAAYGDARGSFRPRAGAGTGHAGLAGRRRRRGRSGPAAEEEEVAGLKSEI